MEAYRRAVVEDAEAIAALGARAWRAAYRGIMPDAFLDALDVDGSARSWRRSFIDDRAHVLVVEFEGVVAGFAYVVDAEDSGLGPRTGELRVINVEPVRWRHGLGSALVSGIEEVCKARGYRELVLWVLRDEMRARGFYEARGFRCDGGQRTNRQWGFPLEQVRYRKRVEAGAS
jgi:GNAT superfamily N-acetyltransferase